MDIQTETLNLYMRVKVPTRVELEGQYHNNTFILCHSENSFEGSLTNEELLYDVQHSQGGNLNNVTVEYLIAEEQSDCTKVNCIS